MKNIRQRIKTFIVVSLVLVAGVFFYYYLPTIFGSSMYPINYQETIMEYSKEYQLEPTLVAAVINCESHFNPKAISPVGASGLMQIMPDTAKTIIRQLKEEKVGNLFDPKTNIRYGTYYLAQKIKEYKGDVNSALVAYNAGNSHGNSYYRGNKSTIPNETEDYLIRVSEAKQAYQKLYGSDLSSNEIVGSIVRKKVNWFQRFFSDFIN